MCLSPLSLCFSQSMQIEMRNFTCLGAYCILRQLRSIARYIFHIILSKMNFLEDYFVDEVY